MKYVLVFLIVMLVAWRWRTSREEDQFKTARKKASAKALPVDMVECAQCGVHVPLADAFGGKHGMYCSEIHLKRVEP